MPAWTQFAIPAPYRRLSPQQEEIGFVSRFSRTFDEEEE